MLNINATNLYKIFRDFYTLTGARIVLFDKNQSSLLTYPTSKNFFCDIISTDDKWCTRCGDCDRENVAFCSKTGVAQKYYCHMGLFETVIPIYDGNVILGYVMIGQVLLSDSSEETKKKLKEQFDENEFPGIHDAIDNIPVKSMEELEASVTILQAITTHILSNKWVIPQRENFIYHIDKYIENHLNKNISVEDICAETHIGRTRLYNISKEYLGCSIATYIRRKRIEHACQMLRETNKSINEIAESVGFWDYGHFSRVFKELKGVSATTYRKDMK